MALCSKLVLFSFKNGVLANLIFTNAYLAGKFPYKPFFIPVLETIEFFSWSGCI